MSDISAQIAGSVGLAGSANIGQECAMFEAIHGSAPRRAGQNMANPSGLLLGGIQMLNYMGKNEIAEKIENAWLSTIEQGIHTYDIYDEKTSKKKVSTSEFADEIIARLGEKPQKLPEVNYPKDAKKIQITLSEAKKQEKSLDGFDVFIECDDRNPDHLGERLLAATQKNKLELNMITNRGVKVFPNGNPLTFCTDHWRCRFLAKSGEKIQAKDLIDTLSAINDANLEIIKTEHLYQFDGERGYSLGQGQ